MHSSLLSGNIDSVILISDIIKVNHICALVCDNEVSLAETLIHALNNDVKVSAADGI